MDVQDSATKRKMGMVSWDPEHVRDQTGCIEAGVVAMQVDS
ncbi:MAG: hypothetical protein AAGG48_14655 [Planctomycetota bacterium]